MNTSALPTIRFDTAALPRDLQFEAWREAVGVTHEITSSETSERDGLIASSDVWRLGQMVVSFRRFPALRFARRIGRTRVDGLDHYAVLLMLEGTWVGDVEGREVTLRPGQLAVFDLARPVDNWVSANASLRVMLPRQQLDPLLPDGDLHGAVLHGSASALLADYLGALLSRLDELTVGQAPHMEQATRGMVAACLAPSPERAAMAAPAIAATQRRRARRYIDQHLADETLSPAAIGNAIGMSRSALYRLFEPEGGVAACIRQARLDRIRTLLADPAEGRRISDLAFAHGFSSEAHFARAFRRAFGVSASEVRAEATRLARTQDAGASPGQLYQRWVRGR